MSIGKFMFRVGSSIVFFGLLLTYILSTLIATKNGGVGSWPETSTLIAVMAISFFAMIVLDLLRLKKGMNIAMVKRNVSNQKIMFLLKTLTLASLSLLIFQYYVTSISLFLAFGISSYIVRIRAWKIYTDISENDHIVFRKRLKRSAVIIAIFSVLGIFIPSQGIFLTGMFNMAMLGYIFTSFLIGWGLIDDFYTLAKGAAMSVGPTEQQLKQEIAHRDEAWAQGRAAPVNIGLMADKNTADLLVTGVRFIAIPIAFCLGLTMIPFYIYVLATNKVTMLESKRPQAQA